MIFKNEYTVNFILIPILVLIFLPFMLIDNLKDFFIFYTLLISVVYPIYLIVGNVYFFKQEKPKKFLRKSYLMVIATILNLLIGMPLTIEIVDVSGSQILMVFVLIALSLLITLIGVGFVYLSLKWLEKDRINQAKLKQ